MTHTSTVPAAAQTVEVPGARLHHEVRGQGPIVVLVDDPDTFATRLRAVLGEG